MNGGETAGLRLTDEMYLLATRIDGRHALRDAALLVTGAALADLADAERIDCPERTVLLLDATPVGHPALDSFLRDLARPSQPRAPWRWVFDRSRTTLREERAHLTRVGTLGTERDVVLGMVPHTRHPVLDRVAHEHVRTRVRAVVLEGAIDRSARRLVGLLSIAYHSRRTAAALFPELDARDLRRRLRPLRGEDWIVRATAHAVRLTHAARA